jgi:hypothetical protein
MFRQQKAAVCTVMQLQEGQGTVPARKVTLDTLPHPLCLLSVVVTVVVMSVMLIWKT